MKKWLKEIARDLLALGSIPFYFLVVIRAIVGKFNLFLYQLIIGAVAIFILYLIIKDSNMYVARSLVLLIFISLYYKESVFTVFASLIWILFLVSSYYIKRNIGSISRGIITGLISSLAGYYLTSLV